MGCDNGEIFLYVFRIWVHEVHSIGTKDQDGILFYYGISNCSWARTIPAIELESSRPTIVHVNGSNLLQPLTISLDDNTSLFDGHWWKCVSHTTCHVQHKWRIILWIWAHYSIKFSNVDRRGGGLHDCITHYIGSNLHDWWDSLPKISVAPRPELIMIKVN